MPKSKYRERFVKAALDWKNIQLPKDILKIKYDRMAENAFAFYRGSCHLFWTDFKQKNYPSEFSNDKTKTWLQGDLHAYNFGTFSDDRGTLVYGLNDFDESVIADFQYDLWRMAASICLIARENSKVSKKQEREYVATFTQAYIDHLKKLTKASVRDLPYSQKNVSPPLQNFLKMLEEQRASARKKMLDKWTNNGKFDTKLPKLAPVKSNAERQGIIDAIEGKKGEVSFYRKTLVGKLSRRPRGYFKVLDVAERLLAGTGSLGAKRYYVLIQGDKTAKQDDIILDVKYQSRPSAYPYLSNEDLKFYQFDNEAHRCTEAFRALSKHTDDHAGWIKLYETSKTSKRGYYTVRERSPEKDSFPALVSELTEDTVKLTLLKKANFLKMCSIWGEILASQHGRADNDASGKRIPHSFEKEAIKAIGNKVSQFVSLVQSVASNYADQVQDDYAIFKRMLKKKK